MSLDELSAIGEFIGGVGGLVAALGVIASLVFVGVQLRASVRQANAESYATITSLWVEFTNAVPANTENWSIFYQGVRDYDALNDSDRSRFNFYLGMYFGIQDTVMVQQQMGVWNNDATYQRVLDEGFRLFSMPGVQQWWQIHKGRVFAPDLEAYFEQRLATSSSGH